MARYRKVDVRVWTDERFRHLTPIPPCGQGLWFYLLTGPETSNIPGLYRAGEAGLAESLGWPVKAFREAFAEAFREGMVKADWESRLIWVPNAIRYNAPESPNVIRSWRATWDELPECALKAEAWQALKAFAEAFGEAFAKAFAEACPKPSPKPLANQEQEQEQDQEQEQEEDLAPSASRSAPVVALAPSSPVVIGLELNTGTEHPITQAEVDEWSGLFPAVDVPQALRAMAAWLKANPSKRKTARGIRAFVVRWLTREQDRGGSRPASASSRPHVTGAAANLRAAISAPLDMFKLPPEVPNGR